MSLRIRIFIVWVMVCGLAIGQNDVQLRLKTLEVRGLPFFYNNDIEQTIQDWLKMLLSRKIQWMTSSTATD